MLTFTVLCQFLHFQPWIRGCLEDLWEITQMSTSQGVEYVPRGGGEGDSFNTITCNTKGNKGTSTLCSLLLNFAPWSRGYSREELSRGVDHHASEALPLQACQLAPMNSLLRAGTYKGYRHTESSAKIVNKHLAISQNCLTNTLPSLKIIYC